MALHRATAHMRAISHAIASLHVGSRLEPPPAARPRSLASHLLPPQSLFLLLPPWIPPLCSSHPSRPPFASSCCPDQVAQLTHLWPCPCRHGVTVSMLPLSLSLRLKPPPTRAPSRPLPFVQDAARPCWSNELSPAPFLPSWRGLPPCLSLPHTIYVVDSVTRRHARLQ